MVHTSNQFAEIEIQNRHVLHDSQLKLQIKSNLSPRIRSRDGQSCIAIVANTRMRPEESLYASGIVWKGFSRVYKGKLERIQPPVYSNRDVRFGRNTAMKFRPSSAYFPVVVMHAAFFINKLVSSEYYLVKEVE